MAKARSEDTQQTAGPRKATAKDVRDELQKHRRRTPAQIVKALAARGIEATPRYVSEVKYKAKKAKRKKRAKKRPAAGEPPRRRGPKAYPVMTFEDAMTLGRGILEHGAGHPMKRTTLLNKLKLRDNRATRSLITNSSRYGLTRGAHDAPEIKLTREGRVTLDLARPAAERTQAQFELAIKRIEPFQKLYERFGGGKMPAPEVMRDALDEVDAGDRAQCADIFISNANTVGLLRTQEGAQVLLTIDHLIEELPVTAGLAEEEAPEAVAVEEAALEEDFDKVCFFIAPIGKPDSEERKHSDMLLSAFVERALSDIGLKAVRADQIEKPGMITGQVIRYVLQSKLVIADLSFLNPNVFYELSLRHATGKPTVHIVRRGEGIPFDLKDYRTVEIDMTSKYDLVAKLDTYRADIANKARQALQDDVTTDNPILAFCPKGRFVVKR